MKFEFLLPMLYLTLRILKIHFSTMCFLRRRRNIILSVGHWNGIYANNRFLCNIQIDLKNETYLIITNIHYHKKLGTGIYTI